MQSRLNRKFEFPSYQSEFSSGTSSQLRSKQSTSLELTIQNGGSAGVNREHQLAAHGSNPALSIGPPNSTATGTVHQSSKPV